MNKLRTNFTAKNGAIIGLSFIVSYLIFYMIYGKLHTVQDNSSMLNLLFLVVGIMLFVRMYRIENNLSYFSYGEAFKVGLLLTLFSGIIGSSFLYIFYKYISHESVNQYLILQQHAFELSGMGDDEIESMMTITSKFFGPGFLAFSAFLGTVIYGVLTSLFVALFLKRGSKDVNSFDKDMSQIDS